MARRVFSKPGQALPPRGLFCWAGPLCVPVGGGPPARRPRRELRSARRLEARPGPAAARRHRGRALLWSLRHYAHPSNNERPGPQPHKQILNNVRTRPVVQCLPMGRCAYPRLGLLVWALHPIRRHYTPSVRVQRHVTGAPPRNRCTASDSSPAHQSTRKGDEGQLRFREVDHVHQSTRNSDEAVLPTVRHSHPCTHRPHFHLFQEAVHPIRRHTHPLNEVSTTPA